jgi:hypothetical protein
VVHSKVFIKTDIYQAIIAAPAIRVNHRIGCAMCPRITPCSVALVQSGTISV